MTSNEAPTMPDEPQPRPGRREGAKDHPHEPGIRAVNRSLRDIARRAREGSAEDQRLLLAHELAASLRESRNGFNPMGIGAPAGLGIKGLLS